MKQRLGGILCVILGAVLIGTGWSASSSGSVGGLAADCGAINIGTGVATCPTAQITFTKTVQGTDPSPPSSWTVRVTSSCLDPATGGPVKQTVTVPSGGSANTEDLFVYTNARHTTFCSYNFVELRLPSNCTSVFDPASPRALALGVGLKVALTNTCNAPSSSVASTPGTSTTPVPTPTETVINDSGLAPTPTNSSSTAPISNTGPREQVRTSVWIGAALCVLGLMLLVAGRRSGHGRAEH